MIERIIPCVSHSNAGVVLSVIKILIKLLDLVENPETIRSVCKKITPSLVTLLSSEPEIQYVALKNINILIQKRPIIFEKDIKIFFSSFTEPLYNKLEKLEIIYKLVSMNNIDIVLNELKEYASDVDIKFVRRSVKLIGQCAIKLEKAAQRCVETLVELVKTQVSFVIQEAIIALKDIFRRYPNTFEGAMAIINENLRTLDDPEAKAALIWIIGEYSDRIEGAENQLIKFIDNLKEEPYVIQINILDSATKTFLKCQSEESYNILNQVFDFCTKECEDPDVRDRGYMYYRLMTIDPQLASKIIVNDKPRINEDVSGFDDNLLAILMDNLGTMATIYEKPPEAFVKKTKEKYFEDDNEGEYEESQFNLNEDDYNMPKEKEKKEKKVDIVNNIDNEEEIQPKPKINNNIDLLDLGDFNTDSNNNKINNNNMNNNMNNNNNNVGINDLLGDLNNIDLGGGGGISNNNQINNNMNIQRFTVIEENSPGVSNPNKGLEVDASVFNNNNNFFLSIVLKNKSAGMTINNFVIQFNNNPFGLSVNPNCLNNITLMPGQISENNIPLSVNNPTQMPEPGQSTLQTGLRCNLNEYYFLLPCV
jgi:vesicle coat complex subunit